jgi:Transglutaminase-like superfamily
MPIAGFRAIRLLAAIPFAGALGLFVDWQYDNAVLRQQSIEITSNSSTDHARIRAINDWVYHHRGFGKNDHYFIVPALGPTPTQVLAAGGDCSDKSRLVAAMLNELNIEAGLVMMSPCPQCGFIHTVVEAEYESGRMVVDPTWNVDYPAAGGGFLGVHDLAGTNLGRERVTELQSQRGAMDKIAVMPEADATFDHAAALNWNKNMAARSIAATLRLLGYAPEQIIRPRFLEDPKFGLVIGLSFVGMGIIVGALLLGVSRGLMRRMADRRMREPGETVEPAAL